MLSVVSTSRKPGAIWFCSAPRSCLCARAMNKKSDGSAQIERSRWNLNLLINRSRQIKMARCPHAALRNQRNTQDVISLFITLFAALVIAWPSGACGPFFPNMMLVGGDEPVLTGPVAHFV